MIRLLDGVIRLIGGFAGVFRGVSRGVPSALRTGEEAEEPPGGRGAVRGERGHGVLEGGPGLGPPAGVGGREG